MKSCPAWKTNRVCFFRMRSDKCFHPFFTVSFESCHRRSWTLLSVGSGLFVCPDSIFTVSERIIMKKFQCGTVLVMALLMAACTTNISPDTYSVDSVGDVTRSVPGTIISARPVNVEGTNKVGGLTGGRRRRWWPVPPSVAERVPMRWAPSAVP